MRVPYSPLLSLEESHVASYKIYILKHPATNEVFYVGQTMQDLVTRLSGHISETSSNRQKINYIQEVIKDGDKPIIQEIETIHATCYIDKFLVNERELYWIKYYKSIGCNLLNSAGISEGSRCGEYHQYLSSIKKGETSWHYYYCGKTYGGHEVYDEKKITADGFKFPQEQYASYKNNWPSSNYNPWSNDRFLKMIGPIHTHNTYLTYDEKIYNDLNPDVYEQDNCINFW